MKLGELYVDLGIDGKAASTTLGDVASKLSGVKLTTLGVIGAFTEFGNFWKDSTLFTENAAVAFTNFSNATGLSTDSLQKWQRVGKQVNVSNDAVAGSMSRLQQKLLDVQIYGKGLDAFAFLGAMPTEHTGVDEMFNRLSKAAKVLPPDIFTRYAAQIGIEPILINMFKLTAEQQRAAAQIAPGMSASDIATANEFNKALNEFKIQWTQFMYFMGESAFPALIRGLKFVNSVIGKPEQNAGGFYANNLSGIVQGAIRVPYDAFKGGQKMVQQLTLMLPSGTGRTADDLPDIVEQVNRAMFGDADANLPTTESNSPSAAPVKETSTPGGN